MYHIILIQIMNVECVTKPDVMATEQCLLINFIQIAFNFIQSGFKKTFSDKNITELILDI